MTRLGKRLVLLAALAISACSGTGEGQIPCADESSCPAEFPVCSGAAAGKMGTCVFGSAPAPSIEIVGVAGHAASDVIGNHATVVVDATARASSGVQPGSVALVAGSKTYTAPASANGSLFSFTVPTDDLVVGDFALTASFVAGDGTKVASKKPFTLHVDNVAPVATPSSPTPPAASAGTLVTLDVAATKALGALRAVVTNSLNGPEGEMNEIAPPTGLVHHLGFAVMKDVDDTYTVTLTPADLAGNTGAPVTASFNVVASPAFGARPFSVTWSASGTSSITAGSAPAHGTYSFVIPQLSGAAGTVSITDSKGASYGESASIKAAAAGNGVLSGVAIAPASVNEPGTLSFTLTIRNGATTAATRTAMATLAVVAAPSIASFSMSPAVVTDGSPASVSFIATTASALLSGTGGMSVPATRVSSGDSIVAPYGQTTSFSLQASNGVGDPAGVVTFGTPVTVQSVPAPGGSLTLTSAASFTISSVPTFSVSVSGGACAIAGNCAIRTTDCNGPRVLDVAGNFTINASVGPISATTTYVLCLKNGATTPATFASPPITVTRFAAPGPYTFALFSNTIGLGATTALLFSISPGSIPNATSAVITGAGQTTGNVLGTVNPSLSAPSSTATYTLTVKNAAGDAAGTSTATVTVVVGESLGQSALTTARLGAAAVVLPDNRIVITGGSTDRTLANAVDTATIYDPVTGTLSDGAAGTTLNMQAARAFHTATLIGSNSNPPYQVFVAGGTTATAKAEIITVQARSSGVAAAAAASDSLKGADGQGHRCFHNATRVPGPNSTRVLLTGGNDCAGVATAANSVELWVQGTGTTLKANALASAHVSGTATLLSDGSLLVIGGGTNMAQQKPPPIDDSFAWYREVPMSVARTDHTATLLPNDNVLVIGGAPTSTTVTRTAEMYTFGSASFSPIGGAGLSTGRAGHQAMRLPAGPVLVFGGDDRNGTSFKSSEFYDPLNNRFFGGPALLNQRTLFTALSPGPGLLLLAGGSPAGVELLILP